MNAEEELSTVLTELRSRHDVLPFMDRQIPAADAVFRPLPDGMVDVIAGCADFRPPEPGSPPVWLQLESEGGGHTVLIVARQRADGELWVVAPATGA